MSKVESIVICQLPQGYTASLRFEDSRDDCDISANSRWFIFEQLDKLINEDGLRTAKRIHVPPRFGAHLRRPRRPRPGQGIDHLKDQGSAAY